MSEEELGPDKLETARGTVLRRVFARPGRLGAAAEAAGADVLGG